ncbi:NAD(P)/FAD-dependent oxidoreductase [Streptomyces aurantiacus]|uniref:NAD(P)/FAD-dependent oxidoreductase n=1 Tax=Streptomyces aurantiacus TaxID=47760 RepID=UPI000B17C954|nr:NAD(P)/FAD-dependent oxidoreductase [Streptomyces aurantiacus]
MNENDIGGGSGSGMRDCVVVGAGAAGLSAALTLVRARRSTLVVDAGRQSNLAAAGIGGLLGHDRRPPAQFYAAGRTELMAYPSVELHTGEVTHGVHEDDGSFTVTFGDGRRERARSMVLAPGMDYRYPRLPGMDERWGGSVFHCPFCHGWEVTGRPMGVLASGAVGVHGALNLRAWSDRVTLLTNGSELTDQQREQLAVGRVGLDERPISRLDGPGAELRAAVFADGGELPIGALLVKTTLYQRSSLARDVGAGLTEPDEMLSVEAIKVDAMCRTGVSGLYAAGDAATSVPPSMASAVASGHLAGAAATVHLAAGY